MRLVLSFFPFILHARMAGAVQTLVWSVSVHVFVLRCPCLFLSCVVLWSFFYRWRFLTEKGFVLLTFSVVRCPPNFVQDPLSCRCYLSVQDKLTWAAAESRCTAEHPQAYLANIGTAAEDMFITTFGSKNSPEKYCLKRL